MTKYLLRSLLLSWYLLIASSLYSQDFIKIDSVEFKAQVISFASDFNQDLFVGLGDGSIIKLDPTGKILQELSLPNKLSYSHIDPWNPLRIFAFSSEGQNFTIVERFNARPLEYSIDDYSDQLIECATVATDGNIWMITNPGQYLIKANKGSGIQQLSIPLAQLTSKSIIWMRAYKSVLIAASIDQILILDQNGQLIRTIQTDAINTYNLILDQIQYLNRENEIISISLESFNQKGHNAPSGYLNGFLQQDRIILQKENGFDFYKRR
jgi:hypothetical protein